MKELIIEAVKAAYEKAEKQLPETEIETRKISLQGVNPYELPEYLKKEGVPEKCWIGLEEDYFGVDYFVFWEVEVPISAKTRNYFLMRRFYNAAWKNVCEALEEKGYERVPYKYSTKDSIYLDETQLLVKFLEKDYETIVKHYSCFLVENKQQGKGK